MDRDQFDAFNSLMAQEAESGDYDDLIEMAEGGPVGEDMESEVEPELSYFAEGGSVKRPRRAAQMLRHFADGGDVAALAQDAPVDRLLSPTVAAPAAVPSFKVDLPTFNPVAAPLSGPNLPATTPASLAGLGTQPSLVQPMQAPTTTARSLFEQISPTTLAGTTSPYAAAATSSYTPTVQTFTKPTLLTKEEVEKAQPPLVVYEPSIKFGGIKSYQGPLQTSPYRDETQEQSQARTDAGLVGGTGTINVGNQQVPVMTKTVTPLGYEYTPYTTLTPEQIAGSGNKAQILDLFKGIVTQQEKDVTNLRNEYVQAMSYGNMPLAASLKDILIKQEGELTAAKADQLAANKYFTGTGGAYETPAMYQARREAELLKGYGGKYTGLDLGAIGVTPETKADPFTAALTQQQNEYTTANTIYNNLSTTYGKDSQVAKDYFANVVTPQKDEYDRLLGIQTKIVAPKGAADLYTTVKNAAAYKGYTAPTLAEYRNVAQTEAKFAPVISGFEGNIRTLTEARNRADAQGLSGYASNFDALIQKENEKLEQARGARQSAVDQAQPDPMRDYILGKQLTAQKIEGFANQDWDFGKIDFSRMNVNDFQPLITRQQQDQAAAQNTYNQLAGLYGANSDVAKNFKTDVLDQQIRDVTAATNLKTAAQAAITAYNTGKSYAAYTKPNIGISKTTSDKAINDTFDNLIRNTYEKRIGLLDAAKAKAEQAGLGQYGEYFNTLMNNVNETINQANRDRDAYFAKRDQLAGRAAGSPPEGEISDPVQRLIAQQSRTKDQGMDSTARAMLKKFAGGGEAKASAAPEEDDDRIPDMPPNPTDEDVEEFRRKLKRLDDRSYWKRQGPNSADERVSGNIEDLNLYYPMPMYTTEEMRGYSMPMQDDLEEMQAKKEARYYRHGGPVHFGKGGAVKKAAEALKAFLEPSAVKQRLYHATPENFVEFKPGGGNPTRSGPAIWMTPNKEFQPAAHNIRQVPDKPGYMYGSSSNMFTPGTNVMPLYAQLKNPLVTTEKTWKEDFKALGGGNPWTLDQKDVDRIKSAGHDGILYYDAEGTLQEVVSFDPKKIKSAIGNRGTYDISEPDIRKAKGGLVHRADGSPVYGEIATGDSGVTADTLTGLRSKKGVDSFASEAAKMLRNLVGEGVSNIESGLRGSVAAIPGSFGDIESIFRESDKTRKLATTEEVLRDYMPKRLTKPTKEAAGFEEVGTYLPLPVPAGTATKVAKGVKSGAKKALEELGPTAASMAEKQLARAGLGPMYAVKPKGGTFYPSSFGSRMDDYLEDVVKGLSRAEGLAGKDANAVAEFIRTKGRKYLTTEFGTGDDPLRIALFEGRLPRYGKDKELFRNYALEAARGTGRGPGAAAQEGGDAAQALRRLMGDPEAIVDLESAYDRATGLNAKLVRGVDADYAAANKVQEQIRQKMLAEGVPEDLINVEYPRPTTVEGLKKSYMADADKNLAAAMEEAYMSGAPTELRTQFPKDVETMLYAARNDQPIYDITPPQMDFLRPTNLAESLASIPVKDLERMSFPEAVIQGTKNMKLSRDWQEVISKAKNGKPIPKKIYLQGTTPVREVGNDTQWVRIMTPDAVELEGAAMGHSVGNYKTSAEYNLGGKEGFKSGRAQIYSLRDKNGIPQVTVEVELKPDGERRITRQIQGKFNSEPSEEQKKALFQLFDELKPNTIDSASYLRDRAGDNLAEASSVNWGNLYSQYKNYKEGTAGFAGGGIVKKATEALVKMGAKESKVAGKELTTLQDTYTSLGDSVRARAAKMQQQMDAMEFKYKPGQRVFTESSAKKNWSPYTIISKRLYGDQPVRNPETQKIIRDPATGKAQRTPYEPGYLVRHERGPDDWSEYVLPESAIKGSVDEFAKGGRVEKKDTSKRKYI